MKTDILGIRFDDLTREEAAQAGAGLLRSGSFHYVVTPNPEFILASEKDPEFRRILNEADLSCQTASAWFIPPKFWAHL